VSSICESVARSWSAQVFNSSIATIAIAAGKTREDAIFNLGLARKRGFDSLLNETKTFWRDLVSKAEFGNASGVALSIMKRSVVTVFTAMDQQLSHSIAASIGEISVFLFYF
jgi:GH15 family glucan-1,4-alpha-glucosidase